MSLSHRHARIDAEKATEAAFAEFWQLYPRKCAKLDALKAWRQMTHEYEAADIIAGLRLNLPALERRSKQYIPYPATWLRAGSWMDMPEMRPSSTGHSLIDALIEGRPN